MATTIRQALLLAATAAVLCGALPATIFGNCLAAIKCESKCPQHASPKPAVPTCCKEAKSLPKESTTHLCQCFKAEASAKALPGQFAPSLDFPVIEQSQPEVAATHADFSAVVPILVRNHGPPRLVTLSSQSPRAPPIA